MPDPLLAVAVPRDAGPGPRSPADPGAAALLALRRYVVAATRFRQGVADGFGVGVTEVIAMGQLAGPDILTPRDLTSRLDLTASSVTALLDRLEAAGLARRGRHPSDRRKTTVAVTERGAALLDQVRTWLRASLVGLDDAELGALADLLGVVSDALEEQIPTR